MSKEWFPLVTRREAPFWVSLVCLGGHGRYYRQALDWDYTIDNYRYERLEGDTGERGGTHQIRTDQSARMLDLISEQGSLPFYRFYLQRCAEFAQRLESKAVEVGGRTDLRELSAAQLADLLHDVVEAHLSMMPFLASFVLVQNRLEAEIRAGLAECLRTVPQDDHVTEWMAAGVVESQPASVVRESRSVLRIAVVSN